MYNSLKSMMKLKTDLWVNAFIFYFMKLWIIGKLMPDTMYSNYTLKKSLSVIAVIIRQIISFLGKPFYLFFFVALPINIIPNKFPQFAGQEFHLMVHILFFLNCFIGSFGDNLIFTVTRDKITLIKYMHMNARNYIQGALAFKYIPHFIYYLPSLILFTLYYGVSVWKTILLWFMLMAFQMMGEAVQLFIFDRTGKVLTRSLLYVWSIIGLGLTAAYLPLIMGWTWRITNLIFHPMIAAISLILGAYSLYYITVGYRGYEKKLPRSIDLNYLLSSVLNASAGAAFKEVEMKDSVLALSETVQMKYSHLKGYSYINALFFARHKQQLVKPIYYRLLIIAAIFLAGIVMYYTKHDIAVKISENMTTSLLPASVFLMYFMTVADKSCRAMFYNCDKDMLHYAYYRIPQTILKNFKVRLIKISQFNLLIGGAVCLAAILFCLICGTYIISIDMLLFCFTILLLSILFTTHHLCMYYIFQPYSESLKIKNPFFQVVNSIMYFLCFLCLEIEVGSKIFTISVLSFTIIYILSALFLVYYRAPKSFRVK